MYIAASDLSDAGTRTSRLGDRTTNSELLLKKSAERQMSLIGK